MTVLRTHLPQKLLLLLVFGVLVGGPGPTAQEQPKILGINIDPPIVTAERAAPVLFRWRSLETRAASRSSTTWSCR